MKRTDRTSNDTPNLKPIGFAMAAVVAGIGARAQAAEVRVLTPPPSPDAHTQTFGATRDATSEEDVLVLGPADEVEPLAEKPAKQVDLFDPDVPLGRNG